ncbi:hypothetical protein RB653_003259 [Dictyostelium firmibasis]|uniref:DNA repair metallo-beta-lactamase domain-containing protein n=1 Tax=Dictyostelium firmibasis TaxID=79012 RepID=A0AAN7TZC7_9MYCE
MNDEEDDIFLYVTKDKEITNYDNCDEDLPPKDIDDNTITTTAPNKHLKWSDDDNDDISAPKDIDEVQTNKKKQFSYQKDEVIGQDEDDNYNEPKDIDSQSLIDEDCDFEFDDSDFFFDDGTTNNNNNNSDNNNNNNNKSNNYKNNKRKNFQIKNSISSNNNNNNSNIDKFEKRLLDLKKTGKEEAKKRGYQVRTKTPTKQKKIPPSFKVIDGTNFLVDGFQYKSEDYTHYFLTHFHSDHYVGITKTWSFGNIYCTEETGKLVSKKLGVDQRYIITCEWNKLIDIQGVKVAFLDSNHCPGSALILFIKSIRNEKGEIIDEESILHTGDFRYNPSMNNYPLLKGRVISKLYLDNTYCDPQYVFPPQFEIIKQVASIVRKENDGETLFLFGTYVIGKERILLEVAKQEGKPVHVTNEKYAILSCLDTCLDLNKFTTDESITPFRAVTMSMLSYHSMLSLLDQSNGKYKRVVGFRPTGWTQSKKSITYLNRGPTTFYSVAYSEHSSYNELRDCIDHFRPNQIIPTVDCDSQIKVNNILSHFTDLYEKKKQLTIASFFSTQPVTNFFQSFFKSKSEPIIDDNKKLKTTTTTTTTTSTSATTTATTSSNIDTTTNIFKQKFCDDLIWDCPDDIISDKLPIQSNDNLIQCKIEKKENFNDDLIFLSDNNQNNSQNNQNNKLVLVNNEKEDILDFDDPVFISQQKWIEKQINNKKNNNSNNNMTPTKTNSGYLGKTKINSTPPPTQPQSNKKQKTTSPSSYNSNNSSQQSDLKRSKSDPNVNINQLQTSQPPSQSLITSFFQKCTSPTSLFSLTPPSTTTTTTTKTTKTKTKINQSPPKK